MTEQEWKQLEDLVRKAQAGDEESLSAACEIIYVKLKRTVRALLWGKGPGGQDLFDEAWQDAMLMFVKRYRGIKEVRSLPNWLARTMQLFIWKQQWPRSRRQKESAQAPECVTAPHQQIGTKSITIDGWQHEINVYAPCDPPALRSRRQSLLNPLTDLIIETHTGTSFPDYAQDIDKRRVWEELHKALGTLPERWALAVKLVYFEEESRSEAAQTLGCSRKRLYKLLKMARKRLRALIVRSDRQESKLRPEVCLRCTGDEAMMADDAWWPLVLESLGRHADASYFSGDDGQFILNGS